MLIPAGARVLGETKPVQAFGETRLAVAFHRLLMPDGRTYRLDQFLGLNQIGDAGLRDKVNHHYLSTFGAAAAVGLISGLSQYLGSAGLGSGDGNRTIVIAGGVGDATAQATMQVMNRFLNRLPTITIREGHRVKVYLTSDLELPAYVAPGAPTRSDREDPCSAELLLFVTLRASSRRRRTRSWSSSTRQPGADDADRGAHAAALRELRAQYLTILRMAQGLGNLEGYRIPTIPITAPRPGSLGLRPAVDSGPEQRRRDGCGVPLDDAPAAPADGSAADAHGGSQACHGASIRHHRDHGFGRDDGRPSGRARARLSRPSAGRRRVARKRRAEWPARATTR